MGKLHELLAAESDLEKRAKIIIQEAKDTFNKKASLFRGNKRTLTALRDSDDEIETNFIPETQRLEETVPSKLEYVRGVVEEYWNAVFQKECANQKAVAHVIVEGETIIENAPVTFLLGMEKKLKSIRDMFLQIPTLEPGHEWVIDTDLGTGIYKLKEPQTKFKTKQDIEFKVLYPATDKHPAQIEKWTVQKDVGKYELMIWSGMITSADKAVYLERIDKMLIAVKEARMRANTQDVSKGEIASSIFNYILG